MSQPNETTPVLAVIDYGWGSAYTLDGEELLQHPLYQDSHGYTKFDPQEDACVVDFTRGVEDEDRPRLFRIIGTLKATRKAWDNP